MDYANMSADKLISEINFCLDKVLTSIQEIEDELITKKDKFFFKLFNKADELLLERKIKIKALNEVIDYEYMINNSFEGAKILYNKIKDEKYADKEDNFILTDPVLSAVARQVTIQTKSNPESLISLDENYLKLYDELGNSTIKQKILFVCSYLAMTQNETVLSFVDSSSKIFDYYLDTFNEEELSRNEINLNFRNIEKIEADDTKKFIEEMEGEFLLTKNPLLLKLYANIIISPDYLKVKACLSRPKINDECLVTTDEADAVRNFNDYIKGYKKAIDYINVIDLDDFTESMMWRYEMLLNDSEKLNSFLLVFKQIAEYRIQDEEDFYKNELKF